MTFIVSLLALTATAIVDVNVVTMKDDQILRHQTVVVRNGVIAAIGSRKAPRHARIIDGRDRYLVPGLADMHTHIDDRADFPLLLANGVTTTLNMGGSSLNYRTTLRTAIRRGRVIAPDPLTALLIDGPGDPGGAGVVPKSPTEARNLVDTARSQGYDFIKIYSRMKPDVFDAVMDEAARIGIPVIGHVVRSVGLEKGLERGQKMLAHAEEYLTVFEDDDHPDLSRIPALVALSKAHGVYVCANLAGIDRIAEQWGKGDAVVDGWLATPEGRFMRPFLREKWRAKGFTRLKGSYDAQAHFATALVKALHQSGVSILAGTDTPDITGSEPGFSIHDEIELLAREGLGNYEALATATRVPGEFVASTIDSAERFGEIAPGYRADLLLVDGDPLQDLRMLRHPAAVMVRGAWLTRAQLEAMLERPVKEYERTERTIDEFLRLVRRDGARQAIERNRAALSRPQPWRVPESVLIRESIALRGARREDDAEALLEFAIELYPRSWKALEQLGDLQVARGKEDSAAKVRRRARQLNSKLKDQD